MQFRVFHLYGPLPENASFARPRGVVTLGETGHPLYVKLPRCLDKQLPLNFSTPLGTRMSRR